MKLLGWWRMNDYGPSPSIEDGSGYTNTGTAKQYTNVISVVAKVGRGISFNGSTDMITVSALTLPTSDLTLVAWIFPTAWKTNGRVVTDGSGGTLWYVDSDGGMMHATSDGASHITSSASSAFGLNAWCHIAAVRASNTWTHYINGLASGTPATGGTPSSNAGVYIGNRGTLDRQFCGTMDDVRVYNAALTAVQVASLYNAGMGSSRPFPWQARVTVPMIRPLLQGAA
jgi:hypothetical protein